MKEYLQEKDAVLNELASSNDGLSQNVALERLEKNGLNKLKEAKKNSLAVRFFKNLSDPMTLILIAAAIVSVFTAAYENEPFTDVFIILAVVIINAVLGVFQENKAEKAIEALSKMAAAKSKVLRDGIQQVILSEELVAGDIILLEAGDAVPADARILECASLKVEEAALTGESVPVEKSDEKLSAPEGKDIPLGDRKNMLYMGSTVVYGRGIAVVTATGMDTEMGKIADALSAAKEGDTPLQKKLNQLSKILSLLVLGICVFILGLNLFRDPYLTTSGFMDTFMVAVSLAVAAIPEGLAAVVTVVLSIGVTNMSKRNAVIRKLTAVETLGCTQVICSDKTGTLTQNKMTVVERYGDDENYLATAMTLASDAELGEQNEATGEPTECALVNDAFKLGLSKHNLKNRCPRIGEAPFDSVRKMMSTVHKTEDGDILQFTKGAPDEVLKRCTQIRVNGEKMPLTEDIRENILSINKQMADRALRVLCAAERAYDEEPTDFSPEALEQELCFLGLCGMIDPVRLEVKDAISRCKTAGIRPIMITGDHIDTAQAIAKELGILLEGTEAITGAQLDEISDEALAANIAHYSVYARVQPEHKVRIVKAWQENGRITAMTGDGVNDAPSIKNADIGVGMGITGTDVTKNVADMVLADDNFATIVSAVEEGRRIYDNIRKAIQFLLASNLAEVLAIFTATLLGFVVLKPVHLLWINLITDTFPALALGMEKSEGDAMKRFPRNPNEGIFSGGLGFDVLLQGIIVTVLTLFSYFLGHYMELGVWEIANCEDGTTMAFLTLSMVEIFHSFNMRSRRTSVFRIKEQNIWLWGAMALSFILTTAVVFVPFLAEAFGFSPITLTEYGAAIGIAFTIIPIIEIIKRIQRKRNRS